MSLSGNPFFPSPELWSHPLVPLSKHLFETAKNIDLLLESKSLQPIPFQGTQLVAQDIKSLARLCGGLHDIGKATRFFQAYIRETDPSKKKKLKRNPETNHSTLGALYAFYAIASGDMFSHLEKQAKLFLAFIIAITIKRHHGDIKELQEERGELKKDIKNAKKPNKAISKQMAAVEPALINPILRFISEQLSIELPTWEAFQKAIASDELDGYARKLNRNFDAINLACKPIHYGENAVSEALNKTHFSFIATFLSSLLFSCVQEGDKTNAMQRQVLAQVDHPLIEMLQQYYVKTYNPPPESQVLTAKGSTGLTHARPGIYYQAMKHSKTFPLTTRIHKLEAPTGSGKTLANLVWAFSLRKRLQEEMKTNYRIVYLLPFLSIIEQVFSVIDHVLQEAFPDKPPSTVLLKHHHLIDIEFSTGEETDDFTPNEELFFIEGWNSEIIVSTFYQFFHSLFTGRKKNLRKFNKFVNSIFILDEIQAIPAKYWTLLEKVLPLFLKFTRSYLLVSTATFPELFGDSVKSLSPIGVSVFSALDRTSLQYDATPITTIELVPSLLEKGFFDNQESTLIVVNTTSASRSVFQDLKQQISKNYKLFHLSSQVIPKHRLSRIEEIKQALQDPNQKPIALSTTQLIEAGVDLSFMQGFRDLAPLDSIIQTLGRINRYGVNVRTNEKVKHATMLVQPLKQPETGRELHSYIYDLILTNATKEILSSHPSTHESEYQALMKQYFQSVKKRKSQELARELIVSVCRGDYKTMSSFRLIEEEAFRMPIFIELDTHAQEIWEEFIDLSNCKNWEERRNRFLAIKNSLYEYVINVSKKSLACISDDIDFGVKWLPRLPRSQAKNYYVEEIGFVGAEAMNPEDLVIL